jgi:hypothetical protein
MTAGYGQDYRGSISDRAGISFFVTVPSQTGSRTHPTVISNGYGVFLSPGVNRTERAADHSPQSCVEVQNAWNFTSAP